MAISIKVFHYLSPRLVEILSSTNVTVQEVHNAVREWEDSVQGMGHTPLIDSAGKEDLGGGISVGITSTLRDARIGFAPQNASKSEGTATAADVGTKLIDSAATFITDGVEAGATVINFTDRSVGTVTSVDSETQLSILPLEDGSDNQWEIGDAYKIWNIAQCELARGNLVAVDDNGDAIPTVWPTAFTQIVRTLASGGTISDQSEQQVDDFRNLVEPLRPGHPVSGNVYYWDPVNGDDGKSGESPDKAVKTFAVAHGLVTAWHHDAIMAISGNVAGETIVDEAITISKATLSLRGPGRAFILRPSVSGQPTVQITGDHVSVSEIDVETAAGGTDNGVVISGADDVLLSVVHIQSPTGIGLYVENSDLSCIESMVVRSAGGAGISVGSGVNELHLRDLHVSECGSHGINIANSPTKTLMDGDCRVYGNGGYGIVVGSGATYTTIGGLIALVSNASGDIDDQGTDTVYTGKLIAGGVALEGSVQSIKTDVEFIKSIEGGRWKIVDDQMIFYEDDNITEVARFDLKDSAGQPTMQNVFERERVII